MRCKRIVTLNCDRCQEPFLAFAGAFCGPRKRYCSNKCRNGYVESAKRPHTQVCESCGITFGGHKRRFCNETCRLDARKSLFQHRCEQCRNEFSSNARVQKFCSNACKAASRSLPEPECNCRWCGGSFIKRHGGRRIGKFCSREHAFRNHRLVGIVERLQTRFLERTKLLQSGRQRCQRCSKFGIGCRKYCEPCGKQVRNEQRMYPLGEAICGCGRTFDRVRPRQKRCDTCQAEKEQQAKAASRKAGKARRKFRIKTTRAESVSPKAIFDRDGWMCGICGEEVLAGVQVPHPLSPTLDHIVPLSKGGSHTKDNLQCAHFSCNVAKSDKMPESATMAAT